MNATKIAFYTIGLLVITLNVPYLGFALAAYAVFAFITELQNTKAYKDITSHTVHTLSRKSSS